MPNKKEIINGKLECACCNKTYEISFFDKNKRNSFGYSSYCKDCGFIKNKKNSILFDKEEIINLPNEEWRDILGFEGLYQISNKQRVKSLERYKYFKDGTLFLIRKSMLIKPRIRKSGYVTISLFRLKDNLKKEMFIHKLMLQAFVPNPNNKLEGNHKNGIKSDNRLENLEWCTRAENNRHAIDTGLLVAKKGSEHYKVKFTDWQVTLIKRFFRRFPKAKQKNVALKMGVCRKQLNGILIGKCWNHIII